MTAQPLSLGRVFAPAARSLGARIVCTSMLVLLGMVGRSFGQESASTPRGALFASSDNGPARHKLDFLLLLAEAYDNDVPPDQRLVGGADLLFGGYSTIFTGSAEYRWTGQRVQVGATGASTVRYFNDTDEFRSMSHTGGVGLSAQLSQRTTLFANESVAYAPSYLYGLFPGGSAQLPGDAIPAAPDYAVNDFASYSSSTTLKVTQGLSRRDRLSAGADLQSTNFTKEVSGQTDLSTRGVHGEFSRNVSQKSVMHVGYRYTQGTFDGFALGGGDHSRASVSEHGVDVGVDYSRPLSATRRLTIGASVGTSAVNMPDFLVETTGSDHVYRASSMMSIACEAKAWQLRGSYQRGLEYIAVLRRPVFVDGFAGDFSALIAPRLDFTVSGRYSTGEAALLQTQLIDTYSADVRMRYALTRKVAAYGEYLYYFYDFQGLTQLAPGMPRGLERNGVRIGLTVWVPALRRS